MSTHNAGYHIRLAEREVKDRRVMFGTLARNSVVTIAMSRNDEPYLVSVNYAYDPKAKSIFFHSAKSGKKLDYLEANPTIWCQVMEDMGYIEDKCDYAYRTVQFLGNAEEVDNGDEKKAALALLIDQFACDTERMRTRLLKKGRLDRVRVFKIKILRMTCKESLRNHRK